MKTRVIIHRIVSWWLAFFSILTIVAGYAAARRWFDNVEVVTTFHIITKWNFFILMLYHVIYTFFFVNFKGIIYRHPKKHWVRLIQQISKWLILGFTIFIMVTGFSYYEWGLPDWVMDRIHLVFDVGLTLSIIIHTIAGLKVLGIRKKITKLWYDIAILTLGLGLITTIIILEVL